MEALLKYADIPRSTFYYHLKKMSKPDKYADLKEKIADIFEANRSCYGYRRITSALRKQGIAVNHKLVSKLMKQMELRCKVRRKKYRSYQGDTGKAAPNLVARNFHADLPNQKWTTDVSEFSIAAGKLYLSPVLDMFNGEIISYHIGESANLKQTMSILNDALKKNRNCEGIIIHSDQGWQYQSGQYQRCLKNAGMVQSMSRKGNCLDNAIMESFFGIIKTEMFYGYEKTFPSLQALKLAITEYIEYYNHERIKLRLNGMSPVEYREFFQKTAFG